MTVIIIIIIITWFI